MRRIRHDKTRPSRFHQPLDPLVLKQVGTNMLFFLHCEMCCSALTEAANGSINMPRHARLFALEPTSAVADGRINQTTWEHTSCNREMPKIQEQN